nr:CRISPR-associated helicase Cas3' [Alkaliphilus hydrothermalis]
MAKSNPKEDIIQHTDQLIENYNELKSLYPNLEINWGILHLACLYHDLGKMSRKFQDKITKRKIWEDEIPHGILSLAFINEKKLKEEGFSHDDIKIIANSIAYHHERELSYDKETLEKEIQALKEEASGFVYDKVNDLEVRKLRGKYFLKNKRIHQLHNGEEMFFDYIKIKGLLNRLDYAASGGIIVERENKFLLNSMEELMTDWQQNNNPDSDWNDLQKHMIDHRNDNVVAIAETGMGKTEAGLLWIGDHKGFFTLPLKTALNAMYERVAGKIVKEDIDNRVGLLHSDTYSEYLSKNLQDDEIDIDEYYNKTRQLSLPITVCTLDQIFDFVYRYKGFEPKLATLAYSKVVIDEVQMYSADLLSYLILGLYYITKVGGKFAILTATLPSIVLDLLKEEGIEFVPPKTFTNKERIRHCVRRIPSKIDTQKIVDKYKKNKVLVICNTVNEAQRVYKELRDIHEVDRVNLFHSRFIKKDRKGKEDKILFIGDKKNTEEYGIWVTTQVVEASLDIDFDILFTELSDLNGLFQRLGRCYRGREFKEQGYNCFVFDGGENKCSGVGYVIDQKIYQLSKDALRNIEGPLNEETKMQLVSELYTKENLKDTEYYKEIKKNLDYVKSFEDHELCKSKVKEMFRNIQSKTVIPKEVYENNQEEIQKYINTLLEEYPTTAKDQERKEIRGRKIVARNNLMNFTVSIRSEQVWGNIIKELIISKYESIPIFECKYTEELGVEYLEKEEPVEKHPQSNFI